MERNDIKNRVTKWIQGKHGLIGVIVTDEEPTAEYWAQFYRLLAEIAVKTEREKQRKQTEESEKSAQ